MSQIKKNNIPKSAGPYSQAVRSGDFIFCSGQLPIDPATGVVELFEGDAARQAGLVLQNLSAVLASCGATLEHVVKTTIFLASMDDFAKVNEVYASFFTGRKPARSCVEVSRLPKDVQVEMEAIACIQDG